MQAYSAMSSRAGEWSGDPISVNKKPRLRGEAGAF
jgi:hypothetical protein